MSFYFFTDLDKLQNQVTENKFGPVPNFLDSRYRVTSKHTASAEPNAYAVADGFIFAQDAGSNLVNLILKPTQQPSFRFSKIKYFIYRGIVKSSLFNANQVAPAGNNQLTQAIWDSQTKRNAVTGLGDTPSSSALGIDIVTNDPVEKIFNRENNIYQFPPVKAGWTIGKFNTTGFGFEIMLDTIGFDPLLAEVRLTDNIIQVNALPGGANHAQTFEHWHDKEVVLNYLDPSAFFGSFFHSGLKCFKQNADQRFKENALYHEVLTGAHLSAGNGIFFNRNAVYLDIRNEFDHSLNYFKNYGTTIKTALDINGSPANINYYGSGWPMLVINTGFALNTGLVPNIIKLSLPDGSGDNILPALYVSAGNFKTNYPDDVNDHDRYVELTASSGFTNEIMLAIPNCSGLAAATPVSAYIRIKYLKRLDENNLPVSSGTVIRARYHMDNAFAPYDMKIPFQATSGVRTVIYDNDLFVDARYLDGNRYIGRTGKSEDDQNLTFFLSPIAVFNELPQEVFEVSLPVSIASSVVKTQTSFMDYLVSLEENKFLYKSFLDLAPTDVQYVEIVHGEKDLLQSNLFSVDQFLTISIGKNELPAVLSQFHPKYRVYIGLANEVKQADSLGQEFTKYDLVLRGFQIAGSNLEVTELPLNLSIYTHGK